MVLSWIVALIGLYLMVRSPKPVAVGDVRTAAGTGPRDRRRLVCTPAVGLA